jgi:hypothetical protein
LAELIFSFFLAATELLFVATCELRIAVYLERLPAHGLLRRFMLQMPDAGTRSVGSAAVLVLVLAVAQVVPLGREGIPGGVKSPDHISGLAVIALELLLGLFLFLVTSPTPVDRAARITPGSSPSGAPVAARVGSQFFLKWRPSTSWQVAGRPRCDVWVQEAISVDIPLDACLSRAQEALTALGAQPRVSRTCAMADFGSILRTRAFVGMICPIGWLPVVAGADSTGFGPLIPRVFAL